VATKLQRRPGMSVRRITDQNPESDSAAFKYSDHQALTEARQCHRV